MRHASHVRGAVIDIDSKESGTNHLFENSFSPSVSTWTSDLCIDIAVVASNILKQILPQFDLFSILTEILRAKHGIVEARYYTSYL